MVDILTISHSVMVVDTLSIYFLGALSIASRVDLRCSLVLVIRSTSSIKLIDGDKGNEQLAKGKMMSGKWLLRKK